MMRNNIRSRLLLVCCMSTNATKCKPYRHKIHMKYYIIIASKLSTIKNTYNIRDEIKLHIFSNTLIVNSVIDFSQIKTNHSIAE